MKKIGILTEYYKSNNYGGVLQAYALCRVLNDMGYCAEQIAYHKSEEEQRNQQKNKGLTKPLVFLNPIRIRRRIIASRLHKKVHSQQVRRREAFLKFREEMIPHSAKVYDDGELSLTNQEYEAFIVGSDQVWNPNFWHPGYMLSFVGQDKIKLAYAASLGTDQLTQEQEAYFRENLFGYRAISVREENSIDVLERIVDNRVELVLDPVLLLDQNRWEEVASDRTIPEKYIFTYFLGDDSKTRELVKQYAVQKFKIVSMPNVGGFYRVCDRDFGDYRLHDVSPQDFLSLIKNAELIITDSFHASAFSCIFQKEFIVFPRNDYKGMNTRLMQVTKLFHGEDHFCSKEEQMRLEYLNRLEPIRYDEIGSDFLRLKTRSISFLTENLTELRR